MHIHWIANFVVPPPITLSGGDRIMVECLRRWRRQAKVTVYGSEDTRQLCSYMGLEDIEFVLWPSSRFKKYGRLGMWIAQSLIGCRQMRQLTLNADPRQIIVSSSEFMPNGLPALTLKRRYPAIPLVVGFYLFAPRWFSREPGPGLIFTLYRPFQMWMLRKFLKQAELILTTVEEDKQILLTMGRPDDSVFAVRGGVDLSIPDSVPAPDRKTYDAVFIGRLHPQKGILELMDIWQRVVRQHPQAQLAIIGSGPLGDQAQKRAAQLGLAGHVHFIGFSDGVEKFRIVKASRIIVHPAVYEVGGMAMAEGLVCGLPGVAFDHPALKAYYPRGVLKARIGDLDHFAQHICSLIADPELYARMSDEARSVAASWDWNKRADDILEAVKKTTG